VLTKLLSVLCSVGLFECLQLTGQETVEGHDCHVWRSVVKEGGKRNVYTLWQSIATQLPVRYEMMGYDNLLGSHYDKYYIDYIQVDVPKSLDDAIFKTPASKLHLTLTYCKCLMHEVSQNNSVINCTFLMFVNDSIIIST